MPTTPSTSQQQSGINCGVFATFFTHFMSIDATEPDFYKGDVSHLRIRSLLSILDATIWDLDRGSLDSDHTGPALRALSKVRLEVNVTEYYRHAPAMRGPSAREQGA